MTSALDEASLRTFVEQLDECSDLCEQLSSALGAERSALVAFRMDDLLENNARKESLLSRLHSRQNWVKAETVRLTGGKPLSTIVEEVPAALRASFTSAVARWEKTWGETLVRCRANQAFIQHSLRNLTAVADHLRQALGVGRLYSNKGSAVELGTEGSVVEAEL